MGKLLTALKNLFYRKPEEHEKFLFTFSYLAEKQIRYIIDIINDELRESRKFSLVLRPDDELKEKTTMLFIFNRWGQTLNRRGETYTAAEYEDVVRNLRAMAVKALEKEVAYYHTATQDGETKTHYVCHLESLITRLARDFAENKCVFYMDYPLK